jgi:predicted amidophosphoribosyltransferase
MKYEFKRSRSEFWITVHKNDDSCIITTNDKYVNIINYFFPILEENSPTKWKNSNNYENTSNLWLPNRNYNLNTMPQFINWCKKVTEDVLWLGLNKNIGEYFNDELDYCIASDFNFVYGNSRTEIGEAEYQLKYNIENLSVTERNKYANIIMSKMLDNCNYIPIDDDSNWFVSPMPATETGRTKLAWQMAEEISKRLYLPLVKPILNDDKTQMKNLPINKKIETWEKIYYNNGVMLDNQVRGKNVIVVDDLYQSGATMWEYAKHLKTLGSRCVFGIVCVKSMRDSDNT